MERQRSRSPVPRPNGQQNDDSDGNLCLHEVKKSLLTLTLAIVVRAGLEVVEKTMESRLGGGMAARVAASSSCSQDLMPTQDYETQNLGGGILSLEPTRNDVAVPVPASPEIAVSDPESPIAPQSPSKLAAKYYPGVTDLREQAKRAWYHYHFHDGDDAYNSPRYHAEKNAWEQRFDELGLFVKYGPSPIRSQETNPIQVLDDD